MCIDMFKNLCQGDVDVASSSGEALVTGGFCLAWALQGLWRAFEVGPMAKATSNAPGFIQKTNTYWQCGPNSPCLSTSWKPSYTVDLWYLSPWNATPGMSSTVLHHGPQMLWLHTAVEVSHHQPSSSSAGRCKTGMDWSLHMCKTSLFCNTKVLC